MQYTRSSIAVCLLAKNCGEKLKNTLRQLEHVCSAFASVRFYIVENNSRDNTKAIIAAYGQTHPNMIADCFDDPSFEDLERIERLVLLRNRVLSLVKKDAFTPEYLLMADADVDIGNFNLGRILRKAPQDWVSVTANGRFYLSAGPFKLPVLYYDLFAYLPEEGGQTMLSENEMLNNRAPLHRKLRLRSYVRCRSAFGGMAVYRYDAVKNNAYTAEENTRSQDFTHLCEHIPFSLRLLDFGGNYICRRMKVLYEPVTLSVCFGLFKRRILQYYIKRQAKKILRQRKKNRQKKEESRKC